jgi:putative pyruvate formate lyase activating enzyme
MAANLPIETFLNSMSHYTPMFKASEFPEISGIIIPSELNQATGYALAAGLTNIGIQGLPG